MDLRHFGAVGEGLAITGNAGFEGVDDHRISYDHSDRPCALAGGDYLPVFVSAELGECEATGHSQSVLVLVGGRDRNSEDDGDHYHNARADQLAFALHFRSSL